MEVSKVKTLILLFHNNFSNSKANAALAGAAQRLCDVALVHMDGLYPDGRIDDDREVARLLEADRIVLQFPVQWYATPPLLKAWQDAVLTRMYYVRYEEEGRKLEGRPLMIAATAGNHRKAYSRNGANLFPLETLLRPLQATAYRCGLPWGKPFLLFGANRLDQPALERAGAKYAQHLKRWRQDRDGRKFPFARKTG